VDMFASIVGITIDTQPVDILHAAYEGVAFRLALIGDLVQGTLRKLGLHAEQQQQQPSKLLLIASGGALEHSKVWRQIIVNAIGLEMVMYDMHETTSRGVAVLLCELLKERDDNQDGSPKQEEKIPLEHLKCDPEARRAYQQATQRHVELYGKLYSNL